MRVEEARPRRDVFHQRYILEQIKADTAALAPPGDV